MPDPGALARGVVALGFPGAEVATAPLDALRRFAPGGVLLFGRNVGAPDALRALVAALRELGDPPPLVAIDQEGGRVARIRDGVAALPSAMALGATGDARLAGELAALLGRDLARLGITVDLAPVADLALAPPSTVIGTRAFGDDPARAAGFVTAFAAGLERGGVAATLKHFPGHGATSDDSHAGLPRIAAGAATLRTRELVPFARALDAGAASLVMTAHVVVEALDARLPATLSPAIVGGLLREELGFGGVVISDCLEMAAIAAGIGTAEAAVLALVAGVDLLAISHRLDRAEAAVAAIVAAVETGRLPLARLEEAHARVLRLRERFAFPAPLAAPLDEDAPRAAARRAVTAVRGKPRLREGEPVTVVSFEGTLADAAARSGGSAADEAPSLSGALRRRRRKSEIMRVPLDPDPADVELLLDHLVRLGDREFVAVVRRADLHPAQRAAVERILARIPETLVVSAREPFDALLWPRAKRVVCIYGDEAAAFDGCADVLTGFADAGGALPVRIPDAALR